MGKLTVLCHRSGGKEDSLCLNPVLEDASRDHGSSFLSPWLLTLKLDPLVVGRKREV